MCATLWVMVLTYVIFGIGVFSTLTGLFLFVKKIKRSLAESLLIFGGGVCLLTAAMVASLNLYFCGSMLFMDLNYPEESGMEEFPLQFPQKYTPVKDSL